MHELGMGTLPTRKPRQQAGNGMGQPARNQGGQGFSNGNGRGGKPRQQQSALFSAPKRKP